MWFYVAVVAWGIGAIRCDLSFRRGRAFAKRLFVGGEGVAGGVQPVAAEGYGGLV